MDLRLANSGEYLDVGFVNIKLKRKGRRVEVKCERSDLYTLGGATLGLTSFGSGGHRG